MSGPNWLSDFAPVIPAVFVFMIPIIAILTAHQRKMAELMRKDQQQPNPQTDRLAAEVGELKQAIHQQTIALDTLVGELRKNTEATQEALSQRLSTHG